MPGEEILDEENFQIGVLGKVMERGPGYAVVRVFLDGNMNVEISEGDAFVSLYATARAFDVMNQR